MPGNTRSTRSGTKEAAAATPKIDPPKTDTASKNAISLKGMKGDQKKALTSRLRKAANQQKKVLAAKQREEETEAPTSQ